MAPRAGRAWAGRLAWLILLLALAGCATAPRGPGIVDGVAGSGAGTLAAQLAAVVNDISSADSPRTIFVGAALNGREDVFDRDIRAFDAMLRSTFGAPQYRAVLLSNLRIEQGPRQLPLATLDQLDQVFTNLQRHRRPNDRYVVLLTSHGLPGILEVEQAALWRESRFLAATKIAAWMDRLAPQPTWLVISACHAGSHLARLTQPHVVAMAAAAADRQSFGCSNSATNTWFVQELLAASQAAPGPGTRSLGSVWRQTLVAIAEREGAQRLPPSRPQWRVGRDMEGKVDAPFSSF